MIEEIPAAEWLARALEDSGVTHVFHMPQNLFRTLVRLDPERVKAVLGHSEHGLAYMADGYARASGRPGVVIVQQGPGAMSAGAGLSDAYQAHVPVIAISRVAPTEKDYRDTYQFEAYPDLSSVTRFSAEVRDASRLPALVNQAWREATSVPYRPVHLAIEGRAEAGTTTTEYPTIDERYRTYPSLRPAPDDADVEAALRLLATAQRPVLVAGGGVMVSKAWEEVQRFAELVGMPVATSLSGKGAIDEHHELSVGVTGNYARQCAVDVVGRADLVLLVGAHGGSQLTANGRVPAPGVPIIHIDVNPVQIGKNLPVRVGIPADARLALRRLIEMATDREGLPDWSDWVDEARQVVAAWWEEERPQITSDESPLRPERTVAELAAHLPDDAIVVADTGYAAAWIGAFWRAPHGRSFIRCEGSLGWAFPAAIGVRCAQPDRPVVCFTGDGGFWYHLAELETAVRHDIPTVTVVLNNQGLVLETHILDTSYDGRGQELADYRDVNFAAYAHAVGAHGERVGTPDEFGPALERALASGRPAVLDVLTSRDAWAPIGGGGGRRTAAPV